MRLHRFYIEQGIDQGAVNVLRDSPVVDQIRTVFRLHQGDSVIFFDGSGHDYVCEIVTLTGKELSYRVSETREVKPASAVKLALAVSMIKKDNFEWVIQKGTELGVSEFIPVVSERSEKKGFNMERARRIMIEAVEQSGRSELPSISEPKTFADFLRDENRALIAFHTDCETFDRSKVASEKELVACIGPEGGWSEKEILSFREKGATIAKLETPILRAETAAIAAATIVLVK